MTSSVLSPVAAPHSWLPVRLAWVAYSAALLSCACSVRFPGRGTVRFDDRQAGIGRNSTARFTAWSTLHVALVSLWSSGVVVGPILVEPTDASGDASSRSALTMPSRVEGRTAAVAAKPDACCFISSLARRPSGIRSGALPGTVAGSAIGGATGSRLQFASPLA